MNLPDDKLKKLLEKYIEKPHFLNEDKVIKINQELKSREEIRKKLKNVSKYGINQSGN